jgi:hypothetical protein
MCVPSVSTVKSSKRNPAGFFGVLLFSAATILAGAANSQGASIGNDAQLVSVSIPTGMQIMPRTMFTQTWTFKNVGTNTWTAGQSGYTLNIRSADSMGATRVSPNTVSSSWHPSTVINSGHSVAPGAQGTYSMTFIAPETAGSVTDLFQLNSASSQYFGPTVSVQVVVIQFGSTNQYDRARAVSYANNYAGLVVNDGYFWTNGSGYGHFGPGAAVPTSPIGDDCAHFVSCCIGTQSPTNRGGGLTIPSRVPPTYGEPGAGRLVNTVLIGGGYATEVPSITNLSPGDLIGWNWGGDSNIQNLDHVVMYVGNGLVASHAASCLDVSGTTWYQGSEPNWRAHYIHIFDAPTLVSSIVGKKMVLSWGTNWTSYSLYSAPAMAGTWTKVGILPKKVGPVYMVTNTMSASSAFYRLSMP